MADCTRKWELSGTHLASSIARRKKKLKGEETTHMLTIWSFSWGEGLENSNIEWANLYFCLILYIANFTKHSEYSSSSLNSFLSIGLTVKFTWKSFTLKNREIIPKYSSSKIRSWHNITGESIIDLGQTWNLSLAPHMIHLPHQEWSQSVELGANMRTARVIAKAPQINVNYNIWLYF